MMLALGTFVSVILGFLSVVLLMLVGGSRFPGYSHAAQFISELGARGAPDELWVRYAAFLPAGLFLAAFSFGAWRLLPRASSTSWSLLGVFLFAMGYVVAVFFPCDAGCRPVEPSVSQLVHNAAGMLGYLPSPLFLLSLALAARRWPGGNVLVVPGYVFAAMALVGVLTLTPEFEYVGISQRLIEAGVWGWCLLCGWYLQSGRPERNET